MGQCQHTLPVKPAGRRLGWRTCLRKGCDRVFHPARWNQRYCREPDCLREVHRWQAAKRQRVYRRSPANRQRHAEAEAQRRRRVRSTASQQEVSVNLQITATSGSAWSRSNTNSTDFCDRPGCYEPLPTATRAPARYCGRDCRQAMRRVLDRERKWLLRNRYAKLLEPQTAAYAASRHWAERRSKPASAATKSEASPVGDYRAGPQNSLSSSRFECPQPGSFAKDDHSETHFDRRSRPPPAG